MLMLNRFDGFLFSDDISIEDKEKYLDTFKELDNYFYKINTFFRLGLYHPNRDDEVMRLLLFHQAHDPGFLSFSYCYGRSPVIRLFLLPAPGF